MLPAGCGGAVVISIACQASDPARFCHIISRYCYCITSIWFLHNSEFPDQLTPGYLGNKIEYSSWTSCLFRSMHNNSSWGCLS